MPITSKLTRFGPFELDLNIGELTKNGRKLKLQEQPFRILSLLLQQPGKTIRIALAGTENLGISRAVDDPNLLQLELQPKIELHYIRRSFMVNSDALSFPRQDYSTQPARVARTRISAIELVAGHDKCGRLGTITQLPQNARLEICGDGFNERTVKVRCKDSFYFVFRDDVEVVAAKI